MLLPSLFGLATMASSCLAASLQQVWNFGSNPTNINMHIYVPDRLANKPPIIVAVSQEQVTRRERSQSRLT
mgnify:CR=1 FL=1|jgi:hypothetical protein